MHVFTVNIYQTQRCPSDVSEIKITHKYEKKYSATMAQNAAFMLLTSNEMTE